MVKEDLKSVIVRNLKKKGISITKKLLNEIIIEELEVIGNSLSKGATIRLSNVGIFKIKRYAERKGRNLQTGEPITISARNKIVFLPTKRIREVINSEL